MQEFPPFRLDTVNQCLWRCRETADDERILLPPKAFAVLCYLVAHAGRLVTQEELLEAVWPETYVQPEVLRNHIFTIRRALGDSPTQPQFLETLPRRGYQFLAAVRHSPAAPPVPVPPVPGTLVGRARALGELRGYLQLALQGQRQLVFVTGEQGIGKTALANAFQRQATMDVPGLRLALGQCIESYGSTEAYYPILDALGQLCRGGGGDTVVQTLVTHAPTWLVQLPALLTRDHRQMLQREILGATRERMLREMGEALEMLTATSPLLLVLEDLQWVDLATVDLLSALARRRGPAKLLLLATYRPVDVALADHPLQALTPDLLVHQLGHEIALEALSAADVAAYLAGESSGVSLPKDLAGPIYRHSEGNPLFMVAALDHLTQRGLISRANDGWHLRVPSENIALGMPESLRQMIEAQIARLSTEEQRALEGASVAGAVFSTRVSAVATDLNEDDFEDLCEKLVRRHQLVRAISAPPFPDGTVCQRYAFVHALYREVFYGRLAPGRRARLHRRIGERVEAFYAGQSSSVASELAYHFEAGADWPRAVTYLRLVAETAGRRYAHREAVAILQHALALVSHLPEAERAVTEIEIMEKLAAIYLVSFDRRTLETYEALAARAAHYGLLDVEVRALIGWNPQDADECRQALAEIRRAGDRLVLASHVIDCNFIQWCSSAYRDAHRSAVESLAILCEGGEENPYLSTAYWLSQFIVPWSLLLLGEWGEMLREIEDGITMVDKNGDEYRAQTLRLYRAWLHLHAMDFAGVLAICEAVLPMVGEPAWSAWRRFCLVLAGTAATALGHYECALQYLLTVKDDMERQRVIHDWYCRMLLESALTDLWLAQGDLAQARPQAERFLHATLVTAERTWQALAWDANARVALAVSDLVRAHTCIAQALVTMEGFEVPLAAWCVHATAAALYERTGHSGVADHHRDLSRATILQLAQSLPAEEPLRNTFLSAPIVCKVLGDTGHGVDRDFC